MDEQRKRKSLRNAYNDTEFQKRLKEYRDKIEEELQIFLDWLQNNLDKSQKVLGGLEMRVKSLDSFYEKLDRKDYINEWDDISDDSGYNQQIICKRLPDLIGFRLNCYFFQDELIIYNHLKDYYESGKFNNVELDFSEGTKQANGHDIYKVGGKYKLTNNSLYVRFELQIKSLFHNMWGEVDHKTIYKNKQYDLFKESRKEITGQIYEVLHASDKQLNTLYTQNYTQNQLLEALFYEMTNDEIERITNTSLLGIHYTNFFSIFNRDSNIIKSSREYIVKRLLGEEYTKKKCPPIPKDYDIDFFVNYLNENYLAYHVNMLENIASLLLDFDRDCQFKEYMISCIIDKHKSATNKNITDDNRSTAIEEYDYSDDAFDEDAFNEYGDSLGEGSIPWKHDVIVSMDSWFKKRDKNDNKH